jgi:hypothetical protein
MAAPSFIGDDEELSSWCVAIVDELLEFTNGTDFFNGLLDRNLHNRHYRGIPNPIDFLTIKAKLGVKEVYGCGNISNRVDNSEHYLCLDDFALDVRHLCGNAIRYYSSVSSTAKQKRNVARNVLERFERLWVGLEVQLHRRLKEQVCFHKVEEVNNLKRTSAQHNTLTNPYT